MLYLIITIAVIGFLVAIAYFVMTLKEPTLIKRNNVKKNMSVVGTDNSGLSLDIHEGLEQRNPKEIGIDE